MDWYKKAITLRTEDCVEFLIKSKPGTMASDWRRRSKSTAGPGVFLREFENISTGERVTVVDTNGILSILANQIKETVHMQTSQGVGTGWVFAIVNNEDAEVGWGVALTEASYWKRKRAMTDQHTPEPINRALSELGLDEVSECDFEPDGRLNKMQMKAALERMGFVNDPGFQKFIQRYE